MPSSTQSTLISSVAVLGDAVRHGLQDALDGLADDLLLADHVAVVDRFLNRRVVVQRLAVNDATDALVAKHLRRDGDVCTHVYSFTFLPFHFSLLLFHFSLPKTPALGKMKRGGSGICPNRQYCLREPIVLPARADSIADGCRRPLQCVPLTSLTATAAFVSPPLDSSSCVEWVIHAMAGIPTA